MRITQGETDLLKTGIVSVLPEAKVYLFGSRADDTQKGGDIDVLILANRRLDWKEKSKIRWSFAEEFGEQKIDLVSFTFQEENNFKQLALTGGVEL